MATSRSKKPPMGLIIFALIVVANVAGLSVYMATRERRPVVDPNDPNHLSPIAAVTRAQRAAGLAALEAGHYDDAVRYFTDAAKAPNPSPDLQQLLQIAVELREKVPPKHYYVQPAVAATGTAAEAAPPEPDIGKEEQVDAKPSGSRDDARSRREREQREREQREREREQRDRSKARAVARGKEDGEAPQPGTVVVSSTPPGLMVQLDGRALDVTPLRLSAEAGPHEIALLEGSTVVFSKRVTVVAGSLQSVDPDVSDQVAALRAPPPAPEPAAAAALGNGQPTLAASGGLVPAPSGEAGGAKGDADKDNSGAAAVELDEGALYVVAHSSLGLSSISTEQLSNIFMGKTTSLNGRKLEPILRSPSSGAGTVFLKKVVKVTTRQYRDHWQKVELAGSATAPPIINNAADVWRAVTTRSGALSFALGSELVGVSNVKPVRLTP